MAHTRRDAEQALDALRTLHTEPGFHLRWVEIVKRALAVLNDAPQYYADVPRGTPGPDQPQPNVITPAMSHVDQRNDALGVQSPQRDPGLSTANAAASQRFTPSPETTQETEAKAAGAKNPADAKDAEIKAAAAQSKVNTTESLRRNTTSSPNKGK